MSKYFGDKKFYKMILGIAIPITVQSLFTNFVALLDNVMVGMVGTDQMTGVAIINQLFFVFSLAVFGGMSGTGIFSAQYFGQDNHTGARSVFRMKIIIGIFITVVGIGVLYFFHDPLIHLFLHEGSSSGNINATFNYGKEYLFIMLIGFAPFVLSNCYGSTLKESGETIVPMMAGILAVFFDFTLNLVLIFGLLGFPKLGVMGAAIATVISRFVECGYLIIYTHRNSDRFQFIIGAYRSLKVPSNLVINILKKGSPIFVNEFLWSTALTLQTQALSTRGLAAVAGININNTINNLFNTVFLTMGMSISIIVGQLLGAGKIKEAKDTDTKMITFSVLTSIGIGAILFVTAPLFPMFYNTTGEIRSYATTFIMIAALVSPFVSFTNAAYFTLRSGGRTIITFIFDSGFVLCVNVVVAMILAHCTKMDIVPMFLCVNLLEIPKSIIGFVMVKKDIWLNTIVD